MYIYPLNLPSADSIVHKVLLRTLQILHSYLTYVSGLREKLTQTNCDNLVACLAQITVWRREMFKMHEAVSHYVSGNMSGVRELMQEYNIQFPDIASSESIQMGRSFIFLGHWICVEISITG